MGAQIGFTTADPSLGEKYAAKCERKDRETTTATLGFRLGGMQARSTLTACVFIRDGNMCTITAGADAEGAYCQVSKRSVAPNPGETSTGPAETSTASAAAAEGAARRDGLALFRAPRPWCKALDAEGIRAALRRFFR